MQRIARYMAETCQRRHKAARNSDLFDTRTDWAHAARIKEAARAQADIIIFSDISGAGDRI
jgi:hypothetical protein